MPQEIHDGSVDSHSGADASSKLSSQVFSDPAEFLKVLRVDFQDIALTDQKYIHQNDLLAYSDHGSDAKGRAAAKIAAEHYNDLAIIAPRTNGPDYFKPNGISDDDLKKDVDVMQGKTDSMYSDIRSSNIAFLATQIGVTGVTGGLAAWGAALGQLDLLEISLATAAGFGVVGTVYGTKRLINEKKDFETVTAMDQQMVKSWL